jgi:PhnB protein
MDTARIAPWLSVADATRAVDFYARGFGAVELERLERAPGEVEVAELAIAGATFWVQRDGAASPEALGGRSPVRMILVVDDPDALYARAVAAGATPIAPIGEGHGWRVGRVADPDGHHWEIGRRLRR